MKRISEDRFLRKMADRRMDIDGREMPDPRPMQPPVGFSRQPSMMDHMRSMVRQELLRRSHEMEGESPEDTMDMGEDDEDVVQRLTQYEREDLEMELARRELAEAAARQSSSESEELRPQAAPQSPAPEAPVAQAAAPAAAVLASEGKSQ